MSRSDPAPALLPIDDAIAEILRRVTPLRAEVLRLGDALGRFLAEDVSSPLDLPPFTNTAMDGYALRAADTPGRLSVVGESAAGSPFSGTLGPGEAVAISTGAVIPQGADAVAQIEIVEVLEAGAEIEVGRTVRLDEAIRHAGGDIRRGDRVLAQGTRIGPAQIGAAAAVGLERLSCGTLPRVAILTTGSELRRPGEPLGLGQIYDSNGPMLQALLETAGAAVTHIPAAADTESAHRDALSAALDHDVVISSGGVSVGPHDLVRSVGETLGVQEVFWRVALRPGKPVAFGVRDRTLLFGLPGNPVSTLVCFELFVRPALSALQGAGTPAPEFDTRRLATTVARNPARDDLIRVQINADGAVEPLRGQESHQIAVTALSDGLARIPMGQGEVSAGDDVAFLPLHGL